MHSSGDGGVPRHGLRAPGPALFVCLALRGVRHRHLGRRNQNPAAHRRLGHHPARRHQFSLGGAFRLGGFPLYALRGPRYALGSVGYRQPLLRLPNLLGGKSYADALVEAGSVFDRLAAAQVKGSFTAGLAADTRLGPFFAGGSAGHNGKLRVYFMMGRLVR